MDRTTKGLSAGEYMSSLKKGVNGSFQLAGCRGRKRKGGCFRRPEWMMLAELVLVMVPGPVEDERIFSALKISE
eukprot:1157419-Pelagomonas_calceolata.AAC.5